MLNGATIASIITGILALCGALGAAYMSGLNESWKEARANKKALARYSVPLIIAAWDLANWFYDITADDFYTEERCDAYGAGWPSQFTSFLMGQYFAGVHIVREMTHFFAHINNTEAEKLKKLLWKIQDEFISMHNDGRESLEMRWKERHLLAVQEHMTEFVKGPKETGELRSIGWLEFEKKYAPVSPENPTSPELCKLFEGYETDFQRIVYRRFKTEYLRKGKEHKNPQGLQQLEESKKNKHAEIAALKEEAESEEERKQLDEDEKADKAKNEMRKKNVLKEEKLIEAERKQYPDIHDLVIVPDHRLRRLQHLLTDLVVVLDNFTTVKLNRPERKCTMKIKYEVRNAENPLGLIKNLECLVPCDCMSKQCNKEQLDFKHRNLHGEKFHGETKGSFWTRSQSPISQQSTAVQHEVAAQKRAKAGHSEV